MSEIYIFKAPMPKNYPNPRNFTPAARAFIEIEMSYKPELRKWWETAKAAAAQLDEPERSNFLERLEFELPSIIQMLGRAYRGGVRIS